MASISDADSSDEVCRKKIKLSDESDKPPNPPIAEDLSAPGRINSLGSFKLKQILSESSSSKTVFLEGHFDSPEETAVVLLEKLPIAKDSVEKLLNTTDLALNLKADSPPKPNIINYACYPAVERGDVKSTIIYPATPKHVDKYKKQSYFIVNETPDIYQNIVLPHLTSQNFSLKWVYNILEHKSETERIIFEDTDPETGFVLLPDLKWDESEKDCVYFIAICHKKEVKSLRDLNQDSLPLLRNIKTKGLSVIKEKFDIPAEKLRVFVHYQPSYYHFHVHFTSIQRHFPGTQFEKAHLLDNVINNIELFPSYYQVTTIPFTLKDGDPWFTELKEASSVIKEKFDIPAEKLRVFVHYQPSSYHFHVHFTSIQRHFPGTQFEKAHLLDNVINNIELFPSYYQVTTIPFTLKDGDPLFLQLKEASVITL